MDFAAIQTEVKDLLNFTDAADQDFTVAQVKLAINQAYKREVSRGKLHGSRDWFKAVTSFTWLANTVSMQLPDNVTGRIIIRLEDVTHSDPGDELFFSENEGGSQHGYVFFKDNNTLQWGDTGPTEDKTIRVFMYGTAESLIVDTDVPRFVPVDLHELLVWSAAIYLREKADENAPQAWYGQLHECRLDYWKHVSRGRPTSGNETTITY